MRKRAIAVVAMLLIVETVFNGCSMQFSPGASAMLNSVTQSGGDVYEITTQASLPATESTVATSESTTSLQEDESTTGTSETSETETAENDTHENDTGEETQQPAITPENFKCREFDILSSGSFYVVCERYDENNEKTDMVIANTPDSIYMMVVISGVPVGILMLGDDMFMLNEADQTYMELNKVALKIIGVDTDDLSMDSIGSMPNVIPNSCEEKTYADDEKAISAKYIEGENTIELITRGDKLLEMNTVTSGTLSSRLVFSSVTDEIPEAKRSIPDSYKKLGMWDFFKPFVG